MVLYRCLLFALASVPLLFVIASEGSAQLVEPIPSPAGAIPVAIEPPPPHPQNWVIGPVWLQQPTASDIAELYPENAKPLHLRGEVSLECLASGDGRLSCRITREEPADSGFGLAALRLSRRYTIAPQDASGAPTAGSWVGLDFTFEPPA